MVEQVKAQVLWQTQFLLQIGEYVRHSGQRHRLTFILEERKM